MVVRPKVQQRVERYVEDVLSGKIPSCRTITLAIKRWERDMANPDLYVDWDVLTTFDKFAYEFKHYKGPLSGQPFLLEDWELFIAANVLSLKWKSTGRRKYRQADIEVPRKNGKTFFVAVLALFLLLLDGESGPEVYTAATDQAQARLCYDAAETLVKRSIFAPMVKIYNWGLKVPGSVGVFKPLSKDTENKDGLNISAAICDEVHAWPNTKMTDVIKTGTSARAQPVIFRISTAGLDTSVPYFRDIEDYIKELEGVLPLEEDHFFFLYSPDKGDDWEDVEVWKKLNPNLGVSKTWDYMWSVYNEAKTRGGSYVTNFKTKDLNMWVNAPNTWIEDEDVEGNNAPFDPEDLRGAECYVGLDLASKSDISAVCLFFPKYRVARFLFVVPEAKLEEEKDRVDYRLWKDQGWLTVTPGKVLDEDWFVDFLLKQLEPYDVKKVGYDPWAMWNIIPKLRKYDEQLLKVQQSIRYMSVPSKWIQTEVLQHRLNFLGNPVIRWMFSNVVIYIDPNANIKLDKARSRNKIDGVVALADSVFAWLDETGGETKEIYKEHTLRIISMEED